MAKTFEGNHFKKEIGERKREEIQEEWWPQVE